MTTIPMYLVIERLYVRTTGTNDDYVRECPVRETGRETVLRDIIDAQYSDISRVICVDLAAGTSCDVTADMALAVYDRLDRENEGCPSYLRDFIADNCGEEAVQMLGKAH